MRMALLGIEKSKASFVASRRRPSKASSGVRGESGGTKVVLAAGGDFHREEVSKYSLYWLATSIDPAD